LSSFFDISSVPSIDLYAIQIVLKDFLANASILSSISLLIS
jgi:hypothetical protein